MIAKIAYGSSIYGVVAYNHEKVEAGTASVMHTHNMIHDVSGSQAINFGLILRSFEDYLSANMALKTPVAHFSLNPSPEDQLSDEKLVLLSDSYMEKMGYKGQPYIVYKHRDIDREHIHIVSVRVRENGEKINDSYDYKRSMQACRELEKEYGLKQIDDLEKEESVYYLKKVEYGCNDLKRQISNTLQSLLDDYRFQSFGEFNALLSCYNIHCRQVKGEEAGNMYRGVIYNAMDEAGELAGPAIKSSRIGKFAGYDALSRKMDKAAKKIKSEGFLVPGAKKRISEAMKNTKDEKQFSEQLKRNNMDVVFRKNETGRIYGVTFIDHNNKIVFNGSRLGKEFSANVFNMFFNDNQVVNKVDVEMRQQFSDPGRQDIPAFGVPASVDEIFGVFYLNSSAYDAEEEAFKQMLRRKKKRGNRRRM